MAPKLIVLIKCLIDVLFFKVLFYVECLMFSFVLRCFIIIIRAGHLPKPVDGIVEVFFIHQLSICRPVCYFKLQSMIIYHLSCTMYHVSCKMYHVSCIMYHVPCTLYQVSCTMYHCTMYHVVIGCHFSLNYFVTFNQSPIIFFKITSFWINVATPYRAGSLRFFFSTVVFHKTASAQLWLIQFGAGHFRHFLILSIIKNDFFHFQVKSS